MHSTLPAPLRDLYRGECDCDGRILCLVFLDDGTVRLAHQYVDGRRWRIWVYERDADRVSERLDGRVLKRMAVEDFVSDCEVGRAASARRAEARFSEKCVDGRYVPSPDLSHSSDDDDDVVSD